jgi:hypothetical protein
MRRHVEAVANARIQRHDPSKVYVDGFPSMSLTPRRAAEKLDNRRNVGWLFQAIVEASSRQQGLVVWSPTRDCDDCGSLAPMHAAEPAANLDAVEDGESKVKEHEIRVKPLGSFEPLGAVKRDVHVQA